MKTSSYLYLGPKAINRRNNLGKSIPTEFEDMYPFLPKKELNSNNLD